MQLIFRGLLFENNTEIGQKGHLWTDTRSHLKNRILIQVQGGTEFQPADILKYFDELKLDPNPEIGTKGLFEMASN